VSSKEITSKTKNKGVLWNISVTLEGINEALLKIQETLDYLAVNATLSSTEITETLEKLWKKGIVTRAR